MFKWKEQISRVHNVKKTSPIRWLLLSAGNLIKYFLFVLMDSLS